MAVVYGDFESMALHYLKELAKNREKATVLFMNVKEGTYGVGTLEEFLESKDKMAPSPYRVVCMTTAEEFIGLLFARYSDFLPGGDDAVN